MSAAPLPVTPAMIEDAAARIAPWITRTPVLEVPAGRLGLDRPCVLKLESLQVTGVFKARGAFNTLLPAAVPPAGVVTASGGNHGAAVACAAHALGVPARVFVPSICPSSKLALLRRFDAEVTVGGERYADALAASRADAEESGALFVHAYDQASVIAGQGTIARELQAQASCDTILVPVGGGGLVAGIAAWQTGDVRVVAVEPETAPTLNRALAHGAPVDVEVGGVAADALGATRIGDLPFAIAREKVAASVLVADDAIRQTQALIWEELHLLVEPAGATSLAALTSGAYTPHPDERVAAILSGANAAATLAW
ncbi:MAG: threonine/serine dehydratase [Solirubrobacterales bacterium]